MPDSAPDFFQEIRAEPGEEVCDFCSSPDVRWTYPCRAHSTAEEATSLVQRPDGSLGVERVRIDAYSSDDWAACPVCHALIERGDRDKLARRSAKRLLKRQPDMGLMLGNLTNHCRRVQDNFWRNREGAPTPATRGNP